MHSQKQLGQVREGEGFQKRFPPVASVASLGLPGVGGVHAMVLEAVKLLPVTLALEAEGAQQVLSALPG